MQQQRRECSCFTRLLTQNKRLTPQLAPVWHMGITKPCAYGHAWQHEYGLS